MSKSFDESILHFRSRARNQSSTPIWRVSPASRDMQDCRYNMLGRFLLDYLGELTFCLGSCVVRMRMAGMHLSCQSHIPCLETNAPG